NVKASLEVEGLNVEAYVLIYDMVGRVIQRHKINKGKNELEIDLTGYAKGVYSIRIMNDNINQTKKLIVN
ncbi:MAG: T9SS type A sorting domain-containing protein, partial [Bacteroidales bacterium]|nr:T9SS type A sorting domain-containing protein [Bacteroidales bacterium]